MSKEKKEFVEIPEKYICFFTRFDDRIWCKRAKMHEGITEEEIKEIFAMLCKGFRVRLQREGILRSSKPLSFYPKEDTKRFY